MTLPANEHLYRERLFRPVRHLFAPGVRVLDAGCGAGGTAEMLAGLGCRVTALDVAAHPAEWAERSKLGIEFRVGSAEHLPFADRSFDAVWVQDALHHMPRPDQALAELWRVTKPGGTLVVVEANRYNPLLYVRMTLLAGHQHFTRARMRRLLAALDPGYGYKMMETRCLPWSHPVLLAGFTATADLLERLPPLRPWLAYQVGILQRKGET